MEAHTGLTEATEPAVELGILGPLQVRVGEQTVPLGPPKERALLALLALQAGRTVSTSELIDGLWGEDPPNSAQKTLQTYVSGLRKALPEGRVVTGSGGYRLEVDPAAVDASRFEVLVAQARRADASGDLDAATAALVAALALWRGHALMDTAEQIVLQAAAQRLEEVRRACVEELGDLWLRAGRHRESIADLEAAVAAEPLRERRWAQLMLAMYRSDRQAEALRTYGKARAVLVDELGIDPGPELQALEQAILEQDASLAPPVTAVRAGAPRPSRPRAALPQPPNRLVGRDEDVDAVVALLRSDVRMVTLTGAGGAGKTRLAEAVAHAVVDGFADGVVFVHLALVAGPDLVAPAVAQALGLDEIAGESVQETLVRYLSDLNLLLIVDNFEHLLASSTVLADLLAGAAHLKLLVTSRSPLRLGAEYEFEVLPLALPESIETSTLLQLQACTAVELFAERARAARSSFALTAENAQTVARICVRLDGLPLAIELAAARTRVLPPEALLPRLEHRLDLLTGGARDAPDRQRTLRATIEWSYELLTEPERRLFAWLGVFSGWFDLTDADTVSGSDETPDLFDLLGSLIEKSLLRQGSGPTEGRFIMLETVRDFAFEVLAARGDAPAAQARHRMHFLSLAEAAEAAVHGAREAETLAALDAAAANLRVALGTAADADPRAFERLCTALAPWWADRVHLTEATHWIELALARDDIEASAELVMHAGNLASRQDDFAKAVALLERARGEFDAAGDALKSADCLTYLGEIAVLQGHLDAAGAYAQEAFELAQHAGDGASARYASYLLGWVAEERGDLAEARSRFSDDLADARARGIPAAAAHALVTLAELDVLEDRLDDAERRVVEARALLPDSGSAQFRSYTHRIDGFVALGRDDGARAWKEYSAALDAALELGRTLEASWCLSGLASAAVLTTDHALGIRLFAAAHQLRARTGAAEPLIEQRRYETHLVAARLEVGPDAFTAEWNGVVVTSTEGALALISESAVRAG